MGWSRNGLVAIALLLGLTQARAQTDTANGPPPAANASLGPRGVLTAERQKLLAAEVALRDSPFPGPRAQAEIVLSITDKEFSGMRSMSVQDNASRIVREYHLLADGEIILARRYPTQLLSYRFDVQAKLEAALLVAHNTVTAIPLSDAQGAAAEEIQWWSDLADSLARLPPDKR